ncbi:MAG: CRISPR-associated ring nuclease Csm6, partial [Bryobacteraceae bacterium]
MPHVLIAVAGVTPQVVTETLWWLARRATPPVKINTLHIATTGSALSRVRTLGGEDGAIARLAKDLNIAIPKIEIHVFDGPDAVPLEDIRSSVESAAFATGITELVRRLTMDPDTVLHASIAGGRKTMGFHLGHAMSLFGRPYDRLSHVLVPPAFEECNDFWYPASKPTPIQNRRGETLDAASADVELTDIQFVRLRGRLTARELMSAISNPAPLVRRVQTAVDETGVEAQTTLELDAIVAGHDHLTTASLERPLAFVLGTLRPASSLVMRISVRPDAARSVRLFLDCRARGDSIEQARASVQSLVSDLRHALNIERTGYR